MKLQYIIKHGGNQVKKKGIVLFVRMMSENIQSIKFSTIVLKFLFEMCKFSYFQYTEILHLGGSGLQVSYVHVKPRELHYCHVLCVYVYMFHQL